VTAIDFSEDGLTGQNMLWKNNDVLLYCLCTLLAFTDPLPFKLSYTYQLLSSVLIKDATNKCMNMPYTETKKVALYMRKYSTYFHNLIQSKLRISSAMQ